MLLNVSKQLKVFPTICCIGQVPVSLDTQTEGCCEVKNPCGRFHSQEVAPLLWSVKVTGCSSLGADGVKVKPALGLGFTVST